MVSRLEILGLRDRAEVGVEGIDEEGIDDAKPKLLDNESYGL